MFTSTVHSYTYGRDYDITLAKKFLSPADKVLILDDFLANGKAMKACWMSVPSGRHRGRHWHHRVGASSRVVAELRAAGCKPGQPFRSSTA